MRYTFNIFRLKSIPIIIQRDKTDCGPSCIAMICKYHGFSIDLNYIREICFLNKGEVSVRNLIIGCEDLGFETFVAKLTFESIKSNGVFPCILLWKNNHYVILEKIKNKKIILIDPAIGRIKKNENNFLSSWILYENENKGVGIFLEPTEKFYSININNKQTEKSLFSLFKYLNTYNFYLLQLIFGMVATSLISLLFPILTQKLVDKGITVKNISIVYLILITQALLIIGNTSIGFIQNWLILHINSRISLTIISDFLKKLFVLPIKYFDSKSVGDLTQRITDHHRIEGFLTGTLLNSLFSIISIFIFMIAICFYDVKIFLIFIVLSFLATLWVIFYQNRRKELDYIKFSQLSENQEKLYEMIMGMQEIKLYNGEEAYRLRWENLQIKYFLLTFRTLKIDQLQQSGFVFLSALKNILISYTAAMDVIGGSLTLGGLLSISYIIGQTNGPLEQIIGFIKAAQDAKLSMNRLNEIILLKDDTKEGTHITDSISEDLKINNVSFRYGGPASPLVLKNINCIIPSHKTTAIVGESGSGKTTLIKLLLNFYKPIEGDILVNNYQNLKEINPDSWRSKCGVVMQDGRIFNDSIKNNIALDGKKTDIELVNTALSISNLYGLIEKLPLGIETIVGDNGLNISGGEKQRILIARSVYKNPDYFFFDEATSNLDSRNEKIIVESLNQYTKNKTVIVIAHRLSTVKKADKIIVLDKGEIIEYGTHEELCYKRGKYFELIKNQLEFGKD